MKLHAFNAPCEICGKPRGKGFDHEKCSKVFQKQNRIASVEPARPKLTRKQADTLTKWSTK